MAGNKRGKARAPRSSDTSVGHLVSVETLVSPTPSISDSSLKAYLLRLANTNREQPTYSPRPWPKSTMANLLETSSVSEDRNLFKPFPPTITKALGSMQRTVNHEQELLGLEVRTFL